MIVRCSARAAGDPDPLRPVVQPARSSAVVIETGLSDLVSVVLEFGVW
jgi:hypothetical protein